MCTNDCRRITAPDSLHSICGFTTTCLNVFTETGRNGMGAQLKKALLLAMFFGMASGLSGCAAAGPVIAHVIQETINGLVRLANAAIPSIEVTIEDDGPPSKNAMASVQGPELGPIFNGQRHGQFDSYWNNGKPASRGLYLSGKREGHWLEWWPSGQLATECTYRNGKMIDRWCVWDESGRVLAKGDLGH